MTADNQPEQHQIDHWLKMAQKNIDFEFMDINSNFKRSEENDLSVQSLYTSLASAYARLGRAQFLNGEPRQVFRASFVQAVRYIIKSFRMAYDKNDPDYVGDKEPPNDETEYGYVDWTQVDENIFRAGINWALMGVDFDIARELAGLFRNAPDGGIESRIINRYAHALKFAVMGAKDPAKALLTKTLNEMRGKKPRAAYKINFLTLSHTLYGIITADETLFNQGLDAHLSFYQSHAKGEAKDTSEEFICDDAVALANLAIGYKIKVTVEHYTLPKGMLMQPEDPDSWFA